MASAQAYVDQSPYVARRLGFAALPLGCLVVRIISQACEMLVDESVGNETTLPQVWLGPLGEWLAMGSMAFFAWTLFVSVFLSSTNCVSELTWPCCRQPRCHQATHRVRGFFALPLRGLVSDKRSSPRSVNLRAFASERWATMSDRLAEDNLNDRQRPKIGVTPREKVRGNLPPRSVHDSAPDCGCLFHRIRIAIRRRCSRTTHFAMPDIASSSSPT